MKKFEKSGYYWAKNNTYIDNEQEIVMVDNEYYEGEGVLWFMKDECSDDFSDWEEISYIGSLPKQYKD